MERINRLIEEKLEEQEKTLDLQTWRIADLTSKLEKAEEEIERLRGEDINE